MSCVGIDRFGQSWFSPWHTHILRERDSKEKNKQEGEDLGGGVADAAISG